MDTITGCVRGGLLSRAGAFIVDYLLVMLLTQCLAALLYAPTNGILIDSTAFVRDCQPVALRPVGVEVPAQFVPTGEVICVRKFFVWPTARSYVFVHQEPGSRIQHSVGLAIDARDRPVTSMDFAGLQWALLALLRWAMDAHGLRSPGRRLAGLYLIVRGRAGQGDVRRAMSRRYLLFSLAALPLVAIDLVLVVAGRFGLLPSIEFAAVLGMLGGLLPGVVLLAAASAILRRRDPFYDEAAGTSVVRRFDEQHDDPAHLDAALHGPVDGGGAAWSRIQLPIPWVTLALALLLIAAFGAELRFSHQATGKIGIIPAAIVLGGGISHEVVVQAGQWYRLALASFLHWDAAHLAANVLALVMVGALLEPIIGASWFASIFLAGGLSGAAASILYNASTTLSAGASGAIMALCASGALISLRHLDGRRGEWLLSCSIIILGALFWRRNASIANIDQAMHVGGAIAGCMLGLVWLVLSRRGVSPLAFGRTVLGAAVLATAATFVSVPYAGFGDVSLARLMIPAAEVPKSDSEWLARAAELVRRFPRDPRSHTVRAIAAGDNETEREAALTAVAQIGKSEPSKAAEIYQSALIEVIKARDLAHDFAATKALATRALAPNMPSRPELFFHRANAERGLGQLEEAKADLLTFLDGRPDHPVASLVLADVLLAMGDRVGALARTDKVIAHAPENFGARRQRGWFLFLDGQFDEAVKALEQAAPLGRKDHYVAIWLHLASVRAGGAARIGSISAEIDLGGWPGAVIRYLRDEIDEKALLAIAAAEDRVRNQEQLCEAYFYIGERLLLRQERPKAEAYFLAARANCPKRFYEWGGSREEIRKLSR